jgi:hypothetical protein
MEVTTRDIEYITKLVREYDFTPKQASDCINAERALRKQREQRDSDLEAVVNHAYDYREGVRILYQGKNDERPHWRIVQPDTEVRSVLADPSIRYFRARDLAAPDGDDRRCYRLTLVMAYESVQLGD